MNNEMTAPKAPAKTRQKPPVFQVVCSDGFKEALELLAKKHRCSLSHAARIAVFKAAEEVTA